MRTLTIVTLAALVAVGAVTRAPGSEDLGLSRLTVRFPPKPGEAPETPLRGRVDLTGDFVATSGTASFDPETDLLRVSVGPVVLLEGPGFAGKARIGSRGIWDVTVKIRGAYDGAGSVTFRMNRASGRVELRSRGADLRPLAEAGPGGVRVAVELGGEVHEATRSLDGSDPRRWTLRPPEFVPGGPGTEGTAFAWAPILTGGVFGSLPSQRLVIRDQAAFDAALSSIFGGPVPAPYQVPTVDFTKEMVLGAVEGPPSPPLGDHTVYFASVALVPGGLAAGVNRCLAVPGFGPGGYSVFQFVRVPRVDGPVTFATATFPVCYY